MTNAQLARFLLVAFVGAFVLQGLAIWRGFSSGGGPFLLAAMWIPTIAAVSTSGASRRLMWRSMRRFGFTDLALGLLFGWSLEIVRMLMLWATGTGSWNSAKFPLSPDGSRIEAIHGVGTLLGGDPQSFSFFALNVLLSLTVGGILLGLMGGLGEELGWRGTLQPEADRRWGTLWGPAMVGAIWAFWHLPANLAGYNDATHPLLTALLLFPIKLIALSYGYAWLYRRRGSVWGAAAAHGAYNNIRADNFLLVPGSWTADLLSTTVAELFLGVLFAWLSHRQRDLPTNMK